MRLWAGTPRPPALIRGNLPQDWVGVSLLTGRYDFVSPRGRGMTSMLETRSPAAVD